MRRCLSLALLLASAGLLSGCYAVGPQPLYAPGYQYSAPRYAPPQYALPPPPVTAYPPPGNLQPGYPAPQQDDPGAGPLPPPYDTRVPDDSRTPEPFSPSMLEPPPPSTPSAPDDDAAAPAGPGAQPSATSEAPAPAKRPTRTATPGASVPLMGFRPMRGQQGL